MDKSTNGGTAASKPGGRVYVAFWTKPRTKTRLARDAAKRRQSMSAFIDWIIDEHYVRERINA